MPISFEESRPRRRESGWLRVLALMALLPGWLLAYSWYAPVHVRIGAGSLSFGAMYGNATSLAPGWHRFPNAWYLVVELPGRTGLYSVSWVEPRKPRANP